MSIHKFDIGDTVRVNNPLPSSAGSYDKEFVISNRDATIRLYYVDNTDWFFFENELELVEPPEENYHDFDWPDHEIELRETH